MADTRPVKHDGNPQTCRAPQSTLYTSLFLLTLSGGGVFAQSLVLHSPNTNSLSPYAFAPSGIERKNTVRELIRSTGFDYGTDGDSLPFSFSSPAPIPPLVICNVSESALNGQWSEKPEEIVNTTFTRANYPVEWYAGSSLPPADMNATNDNDTVSAETADASIPQISEMFVAAIDNNSPFIVARDNEFLLSSTKGRGTGKRVPMPATEIYSDVPNAIPEPGEFAFVSLFGMSILGLVVRKCSPT